MGRIGVSCMQGLNLCSISPVLLESLCVIPVTYHDVEAGCHALLLSLSLGFKHSWTNKDSGEMTGSPILPQAKETWLIEHDVSPQDLLERPILVSRMEREHWKVPTFVQ